MRFQNWYSVSKNLWAFSEGTFADEIQLIFILKIRTNKIRVYLKLTNKKR